MPRPSLKPQRRREILDAYVACVARYGLEGATQERIAAEAGIARPLLRHNLGNREEMITALVDHVSERFADMIDQIAASSGSLPELIDLVFDPTYRTDPRLNLAFQALVAASASYPEMRAPLLASLERYTDLIARLARRATPEASAEEIATVAHGIAAISMSADALEPLDPSVSWRLAAKRAALVLVPVPEFANS